MDTQFISVNFGAEESSSQGDITQDEEPGMVYMIGAQEDDRATQDSLTLDPRHYFRHVPTFNPPPHERVQRWLEPEEPPFQFNPALQGSTYFTSETKNVATSAVVEQEHWPSNHAPTPGTTYFTSQRNVATSVDVEREHRPFRYIPEHFGSEDASADSDAGNFRSIPARYVTTTDDDDAGSGRYSRYIPGSPHKTTSAASLQPMENFEEFHSFDGPYADYTSSPRKTLPEEPSFDASSTSPSQDIDNFPECHSPRNLLPRTAYGSYGKKAKKPMPYCGTCGSLTFVVSVGCVVFLTVAVSLATVVLAKLS